MWWLYYCKALLLFCFRWLSSMKMYFLNIFVTVNPMILVFTWDFKVLRNTYLHSALPPCKCSTSWVSDLQGSWLLFFSLLFLRQTLHTRPCVQSVSILSFFTYKFHYQVYKRAFMLLMKPCLHPVYILSFELQVPWFISGSVHNLRGPVSVLAGLAGLYVDVIVSTLCSLWPCLLGWCHSCPQQPIKSTRVCRILLHVAKRGCPRWYLKVTLPDVPWCRGWQNKTVKIVFESLKTRS